MGRRSAAETMLGLLHAFARKRRWSQVALARELGMTVPAVRKRLVEASVHLPLRDEAVRPHVYWEVPEGWAPTGVHLSGDDVAELARQLARAPRSASRKRAMQGLLAAAPKGATPAGVHAKAHAPSEDRALRVLEDAARTRTTVWMEYFSQHRGEADARHVSVARILPGPPARFLALDHRSGELRVFRASNVRRARLDASEAFREADEAEVERRLSAMVDGFYGTAEGDLRFFVREPEARWVIGNLLDGMHAGAAESEGVWVTASAAGLPGVARFVVGLGGAARIETKALRDAVRALAKAALAACEEPRRNRRR